MLHIIIDTQSGKGMIRANGSNKDIALEFVTFLDQLYREAPDAFKIFINVFEGYTSNLIKELKENDQNDSSNKSGEQDY